MYVFLGRNLLVGQFTVFPVDDEVPSEVFRVLSLAKGRDIGGGANDPRKKNQLNEDRPNLQ